jgi:hypothetical protein
MVSGLAQISLGGVALSSLAIWRVIHLFWGEDGPWDIFARLRILAGDSGFGRLLDCFYCLSLWVALPFAALVSDGWVGGVTAWLAMSGAATLLERATAQRTTAPMAPAWREVEPEPDETSSSPQAGDVP